MLLEKEKLLVANNFSFSHSIFLRLVLQTREKQGLVWKRVNSLPNCKMLDCSKFGDDILNLAQILVSAGESLENLM